MFFLRHSVHKTHVAAKCNGTIARPHHTIQINCLMSYTPCHQHCDRNDSIEVHNRGREAQHQLSYVHYIYTKVYVIINLHKFSAIQ